MMDGNVSGLIADYMTRLAGGAEKDYGVSEHRGHKGRAFKPETTRYDMNTAVINITTTTCIIIIIIKTAQIGLALSSKPVM
jgi:hypothetical protein